MVTYHGEEGEDAGSRFELETEFRRMLFNLAEKEGSMAQIGKRLGYTGKHKGKRFTELRNGHTKTMSIHQLKRLSDVTGIPLEEILRHATPI